MGVSVLSLLGGRGAGGGVSSRAGDDQASWEGRGGLSVAGLPGVHLSPCLSPCARSVMRRLSDCIPTISREALEYGSFF